MKILKDLLKCIPFDLDRDIMKKRLQRQMRYELTKEKGYFIKKVYYLLYFYRYEFYRFLGYSRYVDKRDFYEGTTI